MTEKSPKPKRRKVDVDLSQTEGDDEICPSNAHSTLSAKLSSAEEDVHSLLNLPLEDAAEAGKLRAFRNEGCCRPPRRNLVLNRSPTMDYMYGKSFQPFVR